MSRKSTVVAFFAGAALYACGGSDAGSTNSYDLAADQVDQAAAALTSSTPDDAFTALTTQGAAGAAAVTMGGAAGGGHREGEQRGKRGGRGHGEGRGGMNGQQLLLWYADLSALQVCRDQRTSCAAGTDTSTCEQTARECVKPLLEAAFAAFCSDKLAVCSDANASATACERIQARCSQSDAGV